MDSLPAWNVKPRSTVGGWRVGREVLAFVWEHWRSTSAAQVLEVGPGKGDALESTLAYLAPDLAQSIVVDRVDIVDARVSNPMTRSCWQCSIEDMPMVPSNTYDCVVAKYVLEHVEHVDRAAREFARVLRPGGRLLVTVPNPSAPEFLLARSTPYAFHRLVVRHGTPTPTRYAFHTLKELISVLKSADLEVLADEREPGVEKYLAELGDALARLGRAYDRFLARYRLRGLMGDAFLMAERPE